MTKLFPKLSSGKWPLKGSKHADNSYRFQVSGVRFQYLTSPSPHMKLHSFRQDLQDYQDFFGLVWLYPVHPVDPVKNGNSNATKIHFRSDRLFFWTAAGLTPKPDTSIF